MRYEERSRDFQDSMARCVLDSKLIGSRDCQQVLDGAYKVVMLKSDTGFFVEDRGRGWTGKIFKAPLTHPTSKTGPN